MSEAGVYTAFDTPFTMKAEQGYIFALSSAWEHSMWLYAMSKRL